MTSRLLHGLRNGLLDALVWAHAWLALLGVWWARINRQAAEHWRRRRG